MKIGKLPNEVLNDRILSKLNRVRRDVIVGPGIGRDTGIVDFGEEVCVITTDPITGADQRMGYIGMHIACNDIAAAGAEIIGVTLTMLSPPDTTLEQLETVVSDASEAAAELQIDILGGHTEVTDAVNRMVLSITAIGRMPRQRIAQEGATQPGYSVIMTKQAGLEGTAILAHDREDRLKEHFPVEFIQRSQALLSQISVVPEGRIAGEHGTACMHDATEGGVLGALWEAAQMLGLGMQIETDRIPVAAETREICRFFGIDPLRLISSGVMIIVASRGEELVERLSREGIMATVIGETTEGQQSRLSTPDGVIPLEAPDVDELYKALALS